MSEGVVAQLDNLLQRLEVLRALERDREITRYRAGLQKIVEGDGFWDAPSLARDLLEGKDVT